MVHNLRSKSACNPSQFLLRQGFDRVAEVDIGLPRHLPNPNLGIGDSADIGSFRCMGMYEFCQMRHFHVEIVRRSGPAELKDLAGVGEDSITPKSLPLRSGDLVVEDINRKCVTVRLSDIRLPAG